MNYVVKQTIWHTAEERFAFPGEVVALEHLDEETRSRLVELGVVEETDLDVTPAPAAPDAPDAPAQEAFSWRP